MDPGLDGMEAVDFIPEDNGFDEEGGMASGAGLSLKWDNISSIRQRMRTGFNLVIHYDAKMKRQTNGEVEATVLNVKHNVDLLRPYCKMCGSQGFVSIRDLEKEVRQLFNISNVLVAEKLVAKQAWAIRRLVQVLKGTVKAEKEDTSQIKRVPKDPQSKRVRFNPCIYRLITTVF